MRWAGPFASRPCRGDNDLAAMQGLLREHPDPFDHYPGAADLPALLYPAASGNAANTRVWEDAQGQIAGFAMVQASHNNLYFHFRPDSLNQGIEREMLVWAADVLRRVARPGAPVTIVVPACEEDTARVGLLVRHGFMPGDDRTLGLSRSLVEPFAEPNLPPGWVLRPLAGEGEAKPYVATHRAAFGTETMTVPYRLAIMREAGYRPELDLVAISPDGTLAAFCVCFINAESNARTGRKEGEIGIVGAHPTFPGRGLGRAMVLAGMRALKQQGMESATLGVAGTNPAAVHVYESAGFRVHAVTRWYSLTVSR